MSKRNCHFAFIALFSLLAGCAERAPSVQGTVTYEGKPIESGRIAFSPIGGQGTPFGGLIENGSYSIDEAYLGKRVVAISAKNEIKFNGREMIMPAEGKPGEELVPEDAVGNMQEVEITGGSQTLDFHLTAPK
ncbi:hypothetical protein [Botrimarina mediterranea]|uniref:hypothetical protein n=1 Tax=Botrimarina mediterranea TaxID=2528022 RepID=UPI00118B6A41|nr:hypothetical protein K2D_23190 [Planctomycetes bacterium K2D]